nr:MAG TPA: hypothetical protein [Caudoviricetes sp.]
MALSPAMESIFANAQQNAASLIETATLAINAKVNTIEEAEKMIDQLSSEAVKFNELLKDIANAMHQVESGDMSKEEAAGIIAPAVKELKEKCCALKIANAEAPGDDITEDEIAILRELIIGAKAAAEDRLVAIRLGDDNKVDPEIEAELNTAEEGFVADFLERRSAKKANKAKVEQFWLALQEKNSVSILNIFGKSVAPLLYSGPSGGAMLNQFIGDIVRDNNHTGKNYDGTLSGKDYIVKRVAGVQMAILPGTIDKKGVTHIIAPYQNKHGKIDIKYFFKKDICTAMMDPIKPEDVAPAKEAYEASIANENYEMEANKMDLNNFNYDEFMFACEAMMDELEMSLESDFAMEAEGADESSAPSTLAAKLRGALAKFKSAFKRGDKAAAEEAKQEVNAAADALAEAEAGADEKKKGGLNKAVKIGLIAAGTVAAAAGLTAAGIAINQKAKGEKVNLKAGAGAIKQTVNAAMHNMKPIQALDKAKADHAARKDAEGSIRMAYGMDTKENRKAGNDAVKIARQNEAKAKAEQRKKDAEDRKQKRAAKRAAKAAKRAADAAAAANQAQGTTDSFGVSEYDLYEVIYEALCEEDYSADEDLASAIEAMF